MNPTCTISARLADIDLVLGGQATRVRDPAVREESAARYRAGGWTAALSLAHTGAVAAGGEPDPPRPAAPYRALDQAGARTRRAEAHHVLDRAGVRTRRAEAHHVLDQAGVRTRLIRLIPGSRDGGTANWHVWPVAGGRAVLRRYYGSATPEEIGYEHRVLGHLAACGWAVPAPLGPLLEHEGRWYCLTRFVPGRARRAETPGQRRQRGADLARLQRSMRDLSGPLGQRHGWQPQHADPTAGAGLDWGHGIAALAAVRPELADWAEAAARSTDAELTAVGAAALPLTLVHGDFAEWNVHYRGARLAGIVDFDLTHVDSRPYELAIARIYRAPEARDGYHDELARLGWPLTEHEQAAIVPVYHAFRIGMVAWELDAGLRSGRFDPAVIGRQLARTGAAPPREIRPG